MTPVRLILTQEDYVDALELHARWSTRRLLTCLAVAAAAIAAGLAVLPAWPVVIFGGVAGGVLGLLVCRALSRWFFLPRLGRRVYMQQKSLHECHDLEWSEEGLSMRNARAHAVTPWDAYLRKKEDDKLVILYQSDLLFQMLPWHALSAEERQSLRPYLDRIP